MLNNRQAANRSTDKQKFYRGGDMSKKTSNLTSEQIFEKARDENIEKLIQEMIAEYQTRDEQLLNSLIMLINRENFDLTGLLEREEPVESVEIKETIRKNLTSIVELPSNENISKSIFSIYGLEYEGKLRHIIMILRQGVCPSIYRLKQAIYGEANYGSFVNAEMLMILTLKLRKLGYYSKKSDEWDETIKRGYNSIVRFAPKVSLALYHFYQSKQVICHSCQDVLAALIFNIAIALPEDSVIEDIDVEQEQEFLVSLIQYFTKIGCLFFPKYKLKTKLSSDESIRFSVYYGVFRVIQGKLWSIERIKKSFDIQNKEFQTESDDEDDLKSILTGVSQIDTYLIDLELTELAKVSMRARNILIGEVQRCLKHGDTKASKMEVKATDENLIIFYLMHKKVPHITNVYRHITKRKIDEMQENEQVSVLDICDAILTCVIYGDHTDYDGLLQKLLSVPKQSVNSEELACLAEGLKTLFIDALPTYEHVLSITEAMSHFGIVYPFQKAPEKFQ